MLIRTNALAPPPPPPPLSNRSWFHFYTLSFRPHVFNRTGGGGGGGGGGFCETFLILPGDASTAMTSLTLEGGINVATELQSAQ